VLVMTASRPQQLRNLLVRVEDSSAGGSAITRSWCDLPTALARPSDDEVADAARQYILDAIGRRRVSCHCCTAWPPWANASVSDLSAVIPSSPPDRGDFAA
jgi:hypothetical protein